MVTGGVGHGRRPPRSCATTPARDHRRPATPTSSPTSARRRARAGDRRPRRAVTAASTAGPVRGHGRLPGRPGSLLVSINYFGVVTCSRVSGRCCRRRSAAAVAISSNSVTCQPGVPSSWSRRACGRRNVARPVRLEVRLDARLPSTKTALARWVRARCSPTGSAPTSPEARSPGLVDTPLVAEGKAHPRSARCSTGSRSRSGAPAVRRARRVSRTARPEARFFCGSLPSATAGPARSSTRTTSHALEPI